MQRCCFHSQLYLNCRLEANNTTLILIYGRGQYYSSAVLIVIQYAPETLFFHSNFGKISLKINPLENCYWNCITGKIFFCIYIFWQTDTGFLKGLWLRWCVFWSSNWSRAVFKKQRGVQVWKFWKFKGFVMLNDEVKCCILDVLCFDMSIV